MEIFQEIIDENNQIRKRFDHLIGPVIDDKGQEKDFIDAFNHDIKLMNHYLEQPESEQLAYKKAFESQENYNKALEMAKVRWKKSEKNYEIGASVVKDLAYRKRHFEESIEELESSKLRKEKLESLCEEKESDSTLKISIWRQIQEKALELDKKDTGNRSERLKQIRQDWFAQGTLARCNIKDLVKIEKEMHNMQALLQFTLKGLKAKQKDKIDEKIFEVLKTNSERLQRYRERFEMAVSWRLLSANYANNLRCDDVAFALIKELKTKVFNSDASDELESISDIFSINLKDISYQGTFSTFNHFAKYLRHENLAIFQKNWLNNRWFTNQDNRNIIDVVVKDGYCVPKKLADLIPASQGFWVSNWVQYWFFRANEHLQGIWLWLKKKCIGEHKELITCINETHRQVSNFIKSIKIQRGLGHGLNLTYIGNSSAFQAALELPELIAKEKNRAQGMKPSWTFGVLLKWLPILNRADLYRFYSIWENELNTAEKAIQQNCREIVSFVVEDFESTLLNSIDKKSFTLPADSINQVEKFVIHYGNKQDVVKFKQSVDPLNILKKFDFLTKPADKDLTRKINEDGVFSFLHFGEVYWSSEINAAVKLLIGIITRENIPKSASEDALLMEKLRCLFKNNPQVQFAELMTQIAKQYIFPIGDDGETNAYQFLKRFLPEGANAWKAKRKDDNESKFIFLKSLLTVSIGEEKDLTISDEIKIGSVTLYNQNIKRYLLDLVAADSTNSTHYYSLLLNQAKKYIDSYDGSNFTYAELVYKICINNDISLLKEYCEKRVKYLFQQSSRGNVIDVDVSEYQFYHLLSKNSSLVEHALNIIEQHYDGSNAHLDDVINIMDHPQLSALYYGKRFAYLLKSQNMRDLSRQKDIFVGLLQNSHFIKKSHQMIALMLNENIKAQNWDFLESSDMLSIIETYGTIQNKESYRLLRISRLLKNNNTDLTKLFLDELMPYLNHVSLEKAMIILPSSKSTLREILLQHVASLKRQNMWEGHAQYFVQFFLPDDKDLLCELRLMWLDDFLNNPKKYMQLQLANSLDAKFHYQNKEIPNDEDSLESFFGQKNLNKVREIIVKRLGALHHDFDDEVLTFIRRYQQDSAIALDENALQINKKVEVIQNAQKIMYCMRNGIYSTLVSTLESIISQIEGLEAINIDSFDKNRAELIEYEKQIYNQLEEKLYDCFKESIINIKLIESLGTAEYASLLADAEKRRKLLFENIIRSRLPNKIKHSTRLLQEKSVNAEHALSLMTNLSFDKLHLLRFDDNDVMFFRETLSKRVLAVLLNRIDIAQGFLQNDDPLYVALSSFSRLLQIQDKESEQYLADLKEIKRYVNIARDYPEMAKRMAQALTQELKDKKAIAHNVLFSDSTSAKQMAFLHFLSANDKGKLIASLKAKIEWMMVQKNVSDLEKNQTDWLHHSKLYQCIIANFKDTADLQQAVNQWVKGCLDDVRQGVQLWESRANDYLLERKKQVTVAISKEMLDQQNQLLRLVLFVRSFGDNQQLLTLEKFLAQIAKKQRCLMMKGVDDHFTENYLSFADKLMTLGGNEQQRSESRNLSTKWSYFHTTSMSDIRDVAVENAISQYVKEFDVNVYEYFVQKHHLAPDFHQLMTSKIQKWGLLDELIEPSQLLKEHPLSEFLQILTLCAKDRPHSFFYSKPSMSDAGKLFVSFCLSVQAHQLALVWAGRKKIGASALGQFTPKDISGSLSALVKQLIEKFDIGRGSYNKSISKAIAKDSDYFASWSSVESVPQKKETKELVRFA